MFDHIHSNSQNRKIINFQVTKSQMIALCHKGVVDDMKIVTKQYYF